MLRFASTGSATDLAAAVEELSRGERRHGVFFLREKEGDIPDYLLAKTDDRLLAPKEVQHLIHLPFKDQMPHLDSSLAKEKDPLCRNHLFPFISETGFLIKGMDFTNDSYILFAGGQLYTWSHREWGELMADWHEWHTKSPQLEGYVDFAFNFGTGEKNYEAWRTAVLRVIEEKWRLALA